VETEALQESKIVMEKMADQIPAIYLIGCEELGRYEANDLASVYQVTKQNNSKSLECMTRHNALVELLKNREN
jgi:hypothetical protein